MYVIAEIRVLQSVSTGETALFCVYLAQGIHVLFVALQPLKPWFFVSFDNAPH